MPELISRITTPARRRTTLGYAVILAVGLLTVNMAALTYGPDVASLYAAAAGTSR
jgi:hypothetical protein